MGRPPKVGLQFFYTKVGIVSDINIQRLMRYHKGALALGTFDAIINQLYENGYYLEWNEDQKFYLSRLVYGEENYIQEIVDACVDNVLFDKDLFIKHKILTSQEIQEIYFRAVKRRKFNISSLQYVYPDVIEKVQKELLQTGNEFMYTETQLLHTETPTIYTGSTQSKINKNKDNNSLSSLLSYPSSTTRAHARESMGDKKEILAAEAIEILKRDSEWIDQMTNLHKMSAAYIIGWLDSFVCNCACRGKQKHNGLSDIMQHFNDWLLLQKNLATKGNKEGSKGAKPANLPNPVQLWNLSLEVLTKNTSSDGKKMGYDVASFLNYDTTTKVILLGVPNKETYEYIEENLIEEMARVLSIYFGRDFKLNYKIPNPPVNQSA